MNILLDTFKLNEDDISVKFTLTDGEDIFKWHGDIPIMEESDIQNYLESIIEKIRCEIYRKQFKEVIFEKQLNETDLEAWVRLSQDCMSTWKDTW
jgi:hypothetical protein